MRLSVVSITIVAKSFAARQLGLAMACYAILSAPFHLILIQGVGWALNDAGCDWRTVWGAVGVALMLLSGTALLIGRGPRSCVTSAPVSAGPNDVDPGSSFRHALSTPAFWVFSLTISFWGMIYSGVALFNVDIFKERGFDQALYFKVLALITVIALASNLFFGWLVNYVRLTHLLAVCLLTTAGSLYGLPLATETWHAYAYGIGLGIASGAVALLFFAAWGRLYGRRELGRIQGVAQMLTVFASASGPYLFSFSKRADQLVHAHFSYNGGAGSGDGLYRLVHTAAPIQRSTQGATDMSISLAVTPAVRFHVSLNVTNLERSVKFYQILFNREPAKLRPDYAKFEPDDPPLVLSLEPNGRAGAGTLNHLGIRLPDPRQLVAMQERLEKAGIRSQREEGVECCYARQTKFWVHDPDNTLWELYTLDDDRAGPPRCGSERGRDDGQHLARRRSGLGTSPRQPDPGAH